MENIESTEVSFIPDPRQSKKWGDYLAIYGWKMIFTSKDVGILVKPFLLGSLVKIQRCRVLDKSDIEEIEKICLEQKAAFIKIEPSVSQNEQVLLNAGFVVSRFPQTPTKTMYINLQLSEEELWKKISKSGKYAIRRAQREGATVETFTYPKEDTIKKAFSVFKNTAQTKKFYMPPLSDYFGRVKAFKESAYMVFVYDGEKELVGAQFFVADKGTGVFVTGGTTSKGRGQNTGYELMWKSILYLKKCGLMYLDLEGLDDPRFPGFTKNWGGFSHFKEKFGGEIVTQQFPYIKYTSATMRLLSKWSLTSL
ncbi:hypothetical protein A3K34_04105 [candidate division WWE3 bacterium RIFOXYC1_FULL_40_10]|nr:MAG: hypothetical protein A3K34_04105 [candidate division WWE3 bacterium RIFOXYC1_FULL_40_10]